MKRRTSAAPSRSLASAATCAARLLSNGVEGLLRVNLTRAAVQPFIGAGLGYKHYNVVNSTQEALSDVTDSANVGYMPAAAGLSVRVAGLMLDGRFGVDVPFTRPAVRTVDHDTEATSWNLTGNVGWEF
ncbi:MAG: hypothetical protein IPJ65_23655 [Archangiaceae bacterium]|nr:hypothetical protein [Archangiaceae bacterium]